MSRRALWLIIFALTSACFVFVLMVTPPAIDDYWYSNDIRLDHAYGNGPWGTLKAIYHIIREHCTYDNSRLGNMLGACTVLLPHWLPAIGTSIMFILGYWLMCRVIPIRTDEPDKLGFSTFFLVFALPWGDGIFTHMYAFNYVWGMGVVMLAYYLFLRKQTTSALIMFDMGLLAGLWHEVFAVYLIAGILTTFAFHREMINRGRLAMLLGAVLALGALMLTPAYVQRWQAEIAGQRPGFFFYPLIWFSLLYPCIWALCAIVRPWRKIAFKPVPLFALVPCLGASVVLFLMHYQRAAFMSSLLGICGLTFMVFEIWRQGRLRYVFSAILATIAILHMLILDVELTRNVVRWHPVRQQAEAIALPIAEPDSAHVIMYADFEYYDEIPVRADLGRVSYEMFEPRSQHHGTFAIHVGHPRWYVLPERMRGYNRAEHRRVAGNAELYEAPGGLVCYDLDRFGTENCLVSFERGAHDKPLLTTHIPIVDAEGRQAFYLRVQRNLLRRWLGPITELNFIGSDSVKQP